MLPPFTARGGGGYVVISDNICYNTDKRLSKEHIWTQKMHGGKASRPRSRTS